MQLDLKSEKYRGLTEEEAKDKIRVEGYNELPSSKPRNLFAIGFAVVKEPMFLLLVAAGTLYLILGDVQEGLLLLCFVFVIMGIEFYQEKKTENALNALKDMASPRALVIREGVERRIAGREVVTDDIFVLQEGDRVPADAVVLYSVNLMVDESLLTGESVPVRKTEWDETNGSINDLKQNYTIVSRQEENKEHIQPGGDDLPFVYSGSMVVQGNGVSRVVAVGMNTEIGRIGKALQEVKEEPTRLKKEMGELVRRLAVIGLSLCMLLVIVYTLTRGDWLNGFLAGITLAMAMLPEEFPVVLTVFLAIGAWRMSKQHVLTRKPAAIETLGSATVLCTDKTGTLTQNRMRVSKLYNGKNFYDVDKSNRYCSFPEPFHQIIEFGVLSSQINPFDPMEKAIKEMEEAYLLNTEHIHTDWQMVKEYPLSKTMLAMSRVFTNSESNDNSTIAAKGAPEAIFDLCHLEEKTKTKYAEATEQMAASGLRVLGVANAVIKESSVNSKKLTDDNLGSHNSHYVLPGDQHDFDFKFIGLIGLSDPIREKVPQAVKECYAAGIRVIMITGDYPVTAQNIANEIGLKDDIGNYFTSKASVITGDELNSMSEDTLCEQIKDINIFARVVPEQKLKIVNALKKNGEVVAMTGDGVNDAPALKSADIGIAMGEKGTDVARESASLVLMDDNFASIVGAIRMGRRISDNLQKALGYIFAIHVPIAGLSLMPIFFRELPLILWPVHIVFMELIIDPACSIIFEAEQEESNIMTRPPAKIDEPFFGMDKIIMSCTQGLSVLAVVITVYALALHIGYTERVVRALTFTTLIVSNIAVILSNRSWTKNIFQILVTPNRTVKWVVGGALFFLILSLNLPILLELFRFERINLVQALLCFFAGSLTIVWFEIYKCFKLKNSKDSRKNRA
ncbi:MAG: cation-translocating P-type ATPase [Desulfamplus sp.]|nr:cation-translocating P-type ATPase [Desulfamplus sp.]MBF0302960.1 cation-translocating P-type ATPase [Desulfamplus sp.]